VSFDNPNAHHNICCTPIGRTYTIVSEVNLIKPRINKEERLLEWAAQNPYLTDEIKLNWLSERSGSCAVLPVSGETSVHDYMDGTRVKRYDFIFQIIFNISESSDGLNAENMFALRQWQDWIETCEREQNYPDFGEGCWDYELQNLSNMPQVAQIYDNLTARYQFPARLIYCED